MTPQQDQLNTQISELAVIKSLQENDKLFYSELKTLEKGQDDIGNRLDKGAERMDGLETMFKDHINTTKENHKETMGAYSDLKTEIKDNKIKDMAQELTKKSGELKAYKEKAWSLVKIFFTGAVGILLGAFAVHFGIK